MDIDETYATNEHQCSFLNVVIKNEQILDAAADVLSKRPDATLASIAIAAGISRTTIFNKFPTRDALIEALGADALVRIGQVMEWLPDGDPGDVREAIARITHDLMPLAPRTTFLRLVPGLGNELDQHWEHVVTPLAIYMATAQAHGLLRTDQPPRWLVASYIGLLFAAWDEISAGELGATQAARFIVDTWLSGASPKSLSRSDVPLGT
jgi:AcrR family transcriptional regulator